MYHSLEKAATMGWEGITVELAALSHARSVLTSFIMHINCDIIKPLNDVGQCIFCIVTGSNSEFAVQMPE